MSLRKYAPRHILSGILRNRYINGENLYLHGNSIPILVQSTNVPDDPIEIIDLALEHIIKKSGKFTEPAKFENTTDYPLLYLENESDFTDYTKFAEEMGYITRRGYGCKLTIEGWKRISESRKQKPISDQAFVAMWFNDDLNEVWENGFKPAIEETGYKPIRIDMQEHNDKICDRIIAEIRKSALLVADFTGQRGGDISRLVLLMVWIYRLFGHVMQMISIIYTLILDNIIILYGKTQRIYV